MSQTTAESVGSSLPESWVFPERVEGWLSPDEGKALAHWASNRDVLEIGSYCGRSTICMAQTARAITCIDTWDGRATPDPRGTMNEFWENVNAYGVLQKVDVKIGRSEDTLPEFPAGVFDMVFIDGDHSLSGVRKDILLSWKVLREGGLMVFHDYREYPGEHDGSWDPGVTAAVQELIQAGGDVVARVGTTIAIMRPDKPSMISNNNSLVYVGMPHHGRQVDIDAARSLFGTPCRPESGIQVVPDHYQSSLLANAFNMLWSKALMHRQDLGVTHFAMIHSDVVPEMWWVEILKREMDRVGAAVISAVIPLKAGEGTTSTGYIDPNEPNPLVRRLTLREVHDLPVTFCADDLPEPGKALMVNTGLWLCDIRHPWCDEIVFTISDLIEKQKLDPESDFETYFANSWPEDWKFSQDLHRLGQKVYATRAVRLTHYGDFGYTNDSWGKWAKDHAYDAIRAKGYTTMNGLKHINDVPEAVTS